MIKLSSVPKRRFGRTNIQVPVLSLGGMRFQQSWEDLDANKINEDSQINLESTLQKAFSRGLNHIETARHYGSSERQLGWAFEKNKYSKIILQTKIPPNKDPHKFESELELSFERLQVDKLDLLSIHGINLEEHLDQCTCKNGCIDVLQRWKHNGKISHIGFSTHGPTDLIVKAIKSDFFDYLNLHWYFIRQDNELALSKAKEHDLGVFIISPTDKGGHLHTPSEKMMEICHPYHPIIFNDLFCLRDPRVHTISVGLSNPKDLELHLKAIDLFDNTEEIVSTLQKRLENVAKIELGENWLNTWKIGLPEWQNTPGEINLPILLWLYNLLEAWDMEDYAKARYRILGKAGHWFPGNNADIFDNQISENSLRQVLGKSPWVDEIPNILRLLKIRLGGDSKKRLWSS